jgi:hypothetical protein
MGEQTFELGDIWESRDPRDNGRQVEIVGPTGEMARHANVLLDLRNTTTGRRSSVRRSTLANGYRLVARAGQKERS